MSQGKVKLGSTRVKLAGVDPGLIAGKARDGGERRDSPSDDQKSGGGALRDAQTRAHLTGQTGEARAAVILAGVELSGCRTSGVGGNGATVHKRGNGRALRPPGVAVSTTVGSGASCGGCGHGHAMAGGEKLSAEVGKLARGGERRGFQGEKEEWLT